MTLTPRMLTALILLILFFGAVDTGAGDDCTDPCPHGGVFDGASCFVAEAPSGTRAP